MRLGLRIAEAIEEAYCVFCEYVGASHRCPTEFHRGHGIHFQRQKIWLRVRKAKLNVNKAKRHTTANRFMVAS